ncbi:tn3 transposase DDE domain protein (plasmid) [Paraburkholderia fungorum]|jgi:TnpA family transposase|uniref:Tn3 transposase DDE domain protein n=1 Tax=Paraburkholderia fungorum TaxID=134537 RepID=A0AAU8SQG3_9BURK|nr:Tn3 family transposase [Paraburkholderia fungorum]AJZ56096.1 tn3 transposase DDE domain protein [Paraburkholderia fungorum]MBB5545101.1 TnpA family transposase [Paraburkholderia fungorum]MBU7442472.1 Tn3 family transposase [Paraburkholderia fungorum]PNE59184.1 Tn3 family transposase [Paraburkholderia fungorum]PZR50692.1 MAG: Tn3 family transposase [Paraburkholderia fungorum]
MATIERTAYPRFPKVFATRDLQACYTPQPDELEWARRSTRGDRPRLGLLVLLKVFQQMHHFPPLDCIPGSVVEHVRSTADIGSRVQFGYDTKSSPTLFRHYLTIREYLGVKPYYGTDANVIATRAAHAAAMSMDQPVDIINATIDELIALNVELPAFSTLDRITEQIHAKTQTRLFRRVARRLTDEQKHDLDRLLARDLASRQSAYNRIKRHAKRPSRQHLDQLIDQITWLGELGDFTTAIAGIPASKLRSLAAQAMSLDASNLKKDTLPEKRYTLIVALLNRMRVRARDDLADMFVRRMGAIHKRASEELELIQRRQRTQVEDLVILLDGVVDILVEQPDDMTIARSIRKWLAPKGDLERLRESCAEVRAVSGGNYLPLLWKHFRAHRSVILRLARTLDWDSTSPVRTLLDALAVVLENETRHREWIDADVDMSFAAPRWRKLVRRSHGDGAPTNRRYLELCVFSYMAEELRVGDLCVSGSDAYADYRAHLLPWRECEQRLAEYCAKVGLPENGQDLVTQLRQWLSETARKLDDDFPHKREHVTIGQSDEPIVRKTVAREIPASAIALQERLNARLPTRNVLDILANIEHWTHFTRHFGPLSGIDPQIRKAAERYLLTIFAMGCNLGPTQAARHLDTDVTAHMLSFVNRRHMSLEKLETAQRELIELYLRLDLPKHWGDGKTVAADGTQYDFYDNNLLAGYHFRYRKMGAVAYRHVADNYIAVFRHFIPPGVWEAIYVIEGLLKTGLSVKADTVHADTQGQSAAVFAFTHLLGIKLMPRIRNWKDLVLYRPGDEAKYRHIDKLFTATIDWELIKRHWQELMQVALSIQAGTISSPLLLRRLGSESRKNRLYLAARELGNVVRTVYLLEWIGSRELRQEVTANTNKIESYNGFAKWLSFGGDVIAENEPEEQQKRLRYNDLIASAVILQNTADMMRALRDMVSEGEKIRAEDIEFLSPYPTHNIRRFGRYRLHLDRAPESWINDALFGRAARPDDAMR